MRTSKWINRLLSIAVLCCILFVSLHFLGKALTPTSASNYFNHDVKEAVEDGENVELVFIGASRMARSFIPSVIKEEMDLDGVFNYATTSQSIQGTYYMLQQILRTFSPKYVVLGVTFNGLHDQKHDLRLQSNLIVADRLSLPLKTKFMLDCFEPSDWLYAIDAYRFRTNLEKMPAVIAENRELVSSGYAHADWKKNYYADRGFLYAVNGMQTGNVAIKNPLKFTEEKYMEPDCVAYLDKIVSLCKEEGIQLFLVTGPQTLTRIYSIRNYQGAVDFYENYAKENGLVYCNLNYLKGREEILPDECFFDYAHTNGEGAAITSKLYSEILNRLLRGESVDSYFYKDLNEMKQDVHRMVSVKASVKTEGTAASMHIASLHNKGVTPLYQVEISVNGGEYTVISPWLEETDITVEVPEKERYNLKVSAWSGIDGEPAAWQVYKFNR